jgi:hypothetical protein
MGEQEEEEKWIEISKRSEKGGVKVTFEETMEIVPGTLSEILEAFVKIIM